MRHFIKPIYYLNITCACLFQNVSLVNMVGKRTQLRFLAVLRFGRVLEHPVTLDSSDVHKRSCLWYYVNEVIYYGRYNMCWIQFSAGPSNIGVIGRNIRRLGVWTSQGGCFGRCSRLWKNTVGTKFKNIFIILFIKNKFIWENLSTMAYRNILVFSFCSIFKKCSVNFYEI